MIVPETLQNLLLSASTQTRRAVSFLTAAFSG